MKTVTFDLDEIVLTRAAAKAAQLDTSVDQVVNELLGTWIGSDGVQQARDEMKQRFARPDWSFGVGPLDDREQRNARA
jgi:hypothetical protein